MMKMMRSGAVLAFVLGLGAAGCGDSAGDAIAKLKGYKDKMCACKDTKCAEAVSKEMSEWASKAKSTKPSKAQEEEAMKVALEMAACQQKAMGGGETPP